VRLCRALAFVSLGSALALGAQGQEQTPPDVPAGSARIEGRVLQGDANRAVPGVEVVLYALSPDGMPGLRRTQSDASGAYAFENVSGTADVAYLVGARYQGIPVPGGRVAFAPGEQRASADIRVADLTSDMRGVHVREQTLRFYREADGVRIEETLAIELTGKEIAYVPARDRARRAPGLRATLPAGVSDFRMPLGVIPEGLARDGGALRYYGPFYPGMQDLVWAYRLTGGEETPAGLRFRFQFTPTPGVERFAVLVPDGVGVFDAPGLANSGATEDGGRRVTHFGAAKPRSPLTFSLTTPPARIDPSAIAVHEVEIVLHADDAAIAVTETHLLTASGTGLLLGTPQSPLLRVPIPASATDVRFGSEAPGLEFSPHPEGGVAVLGSLSPGEVPVQIAYRVPVSERGAELTRSFGVRVPLLRVFVADTGRVAPSSLRLHRARPVKTEDLNYLALEAFDIDAGERVALSLDALPPRHAASPNVARAAALLAALGLVAWLVLPAIATDESTPAPAASAEPGRNEREAIYDALHDLEHDFETDKVSAEDHGRLREELRARAAALLGTAPSERDSGTASAPRAPELACPACSAAAAPEHRFCARCGAALGAPAA
jgi:hypothetical protein